MKLYRLRNPEDLVTALFTQPFTKVNQLVDSGIYAENTARDYLNRLCDIHVLEKKEIGGRHYYLNLEVYRILSE
jgi:Fic family protein